jgi:hypothetical protein
MSHRQNSRLDRLAKRLAALDEVVNPPLGIITVQPPDADHPHGTRVRRSRALTVYFDPAAGEPDLAEYGLDVMVVFLDDADTSGIDTPFPSEDDGWVETDGESDSTGKTEV